MISFKYLPKFWKRIKKLYKNVDEIKGKVLKTIKKILRKFKTKLISLKFTEISKKSLSFLRNFYVNLRNYSSKIMDKSDTRLENRLNRNQLWYEYIGEFTLLRFTSLCPAWFSSALVCNRPSALSFVRPHWWSINPIDYQQ